MRSTQWARWATCALAITILAPVALADRGKKSLSDCTAFDQENKGEAEVEFTVHNSCTVPVDCAISWRVVCAPESRKRRAVHPGTMKLALTETSMQSTTASASVCGDDGWQIDQVTWSCSPNKD